MTEGREKSTFRWSFVHIRPLSRSPGSSGDSCWRGRVGPNSLKEWGTGLYMSTNKTAFQIVVFEGNIHVLEYSVIFKMLYKVNVGKSLPTFLPNSLQGDSQSP